MSEKCSHCGQTIKESYGDSMIIVRDRGTTYAEYLKLCADCKALLLGIIEIFVGNGEGGQPHDNP